MQQRKRDNPHGRRGPGRALMAALLVAATGVGAGMALPAHAEAAAFEIHIKDHRFQPEKLTVPAGQRIKLTVHNDDASPEEFESSALRVEKIVTGNNKAVVYFGPLKKGTYPFIGEFHRSTAKGTVVAQ